MNLKCKIKYEGFRPIIREAAIKGGAMPEVFRNCPPTPFPYYYLSDEAYYTRCPATGVDGHSHVFTNVDRYDAKEVGIEEFLSAVENFTPPPPQLKIGGHAVSFKDGGIQVGCTFVPGKDVEELYGRWKAGSTTLADQFLEAIAEVKASTPGGRGCGAASKTSIAKLDKLSTSNGGPAVLRERYEMGQGSEFKRWLSAEFGSAVGDAWDDSCTWSQSCVK